MDQQVDKESDKEDAAVKMQAAFVSQMQEEAQYSNAPRTVDKENLLLKLGDSNDNCTRIYYFHRPPSGMTDKEFRKEAEIFFSHSEGNQYNRLSVNYYSENHLSKSLALIDNFRTRLSMELRDNPSQQSFSLGKEELGLLNVYWGDQNTLSALALRDPVKPLYNIFDISGRVVAVMQPGEVKEFLDRDGNKCTMEVKDGFALVKRFSKLNDSGEEFLENEFKAKINFDYKQIYRDLVDDDLDQDHLNAPVEADKKWRFADIQKVVGAYWTHHNKPGKFYTRDEVMKKIFPEESDK